MRHHRRRQESTAASSEFLWLGAILTLAVVARVTYLIELSRTPFFDHLILDLAAYDAWAQRIANGEWLGSAVFYQDPLYPYVLGVLYAVFGRHLTLVYGVQIALGTLLCYLIYRLARRLFSPVAGLVAAAFAAVYQPFIFFDVQLEKTSLAVLTATSACLLLTRAIDRRRPVDWIAAGLSFGLTILLRGNYLLLLPFVAAGVVLTAPGGRWRGGRFVDAAWYLTAVALVLGATLVRNFVVSGDVVLTTAQSGQNFYIGNNADNPTAVYQAPAFVRPDPRFEQLDFAREAERRTGRPLAPSEVSRYWLGAGLSFVLAQPMAFVAGLGRKAVFFWNAYEIPDNLDFYLLKKYSWVLRLPLPGFALAAALGLCGMTWEASAWRRTWPLYVLSIGYSLTVVLFFVSSRYRVVVVPLLLVFAAAAICRLAELWQRRAVRRALVATATAAALATASAFPIVDSYNPQALLNLGTVLLADGQVEPAETISREVTARRPNVAEAHNNLGVLLARRGDLAGAIDEFNEAVSLQPLHPDAYLNLGRTRLRSGDLTGAEVALSQARTLAPENAEVWSAWASLQLRTRNAAGALDATKRAVAIDPSSPDLHNNLAIALAAAGDSEGALRELDEALRIRPEFADALFNKGVSLQQMGRTTEALAAYRRTIAVKPDYAEAYANLGRLLTNVGERQDAIEAYRGFLRYWRGDDRARAAITAELERLQVP